MYGGNQNDIAGKMTATSDNGFIVSGYSESWDISPDYGYTTTSTANLDAYLLKVNSNGSKAWDAQYGGSGYDTFACAIETGDGGFVACGYTDSTDISPTYGNATPANHDAYIVKTNISGAVEWQAVYGGNGVDRLSKVIDSGDGYFWIGLSASSSIVPDKGANLGSYDSWALKLNYDGTIAWQGLYGGNGSDCTHDIMLEADGSLIIGGYSSSTSPAPDFGGPTGEVDPYVHKIDANGNPLWSAIYGGSGVNYSGDLAKTADGYIIIATTTDTTDWVADAGNAEHRGGLDYLLIKMNADGSMR